MEDPQPIYFIGIALPPELDKQISDIKWDLYEHGDHLLKPLLPHVTLLHPPSLRGIMPDELIPRIQKIAERYLPITLSLEEVGSFGGSVCFIRVQSLALISLQAQLVKLLPPAAQLLHYRRSYEPHITIAQTYEPRKLDVEAISSTIKTRIRLPQQITIDSVSCFMRILPREYRVK
jgi:2'-5' RNA ligase